MWRSLFPVECPCIKTSKWWWPPSPPGICVAQHAPEAPLTRGTTGARRLSQWDQENGTMRGWGIARVKVPSHQKYTSDAACRPFASRIHVPQLQVRVILLFTPRFFPLPTFLPSPILWWNPTMIDPHSPSQSASFSPIPLPFASSFFFPGAGSQLNAAAFL